MLSMKLLSWLSYLELCLLVQKALKPTAMAHETKMNLTKYCARTRSKHIGSQLAEHSAHASLNSFTSTNTWDALHCRVFSTCNSQIVFQRMQCKKGVCNVLCNDYQEFILHFEDDVICFPARYHCPQNFRTESTLLPSGYQLLALLQVSNLCPLSIAVSYTHLTLPTIYSV